MAKKKKKDDKKGKRKSFKKKEKRTLLSGIAPTGARADHDHVRLVFEIAVVLCEYAHFACRCAAIASVGSTHEDTFA